MPSFWNDDDRQVLEQRIATLRSNSSPQWGKMNLGQMLDHLDKALRMATGELPCQRRAGPLRYWPLRDLVIYALPWPKGAPTAPELLTADGGDWQSRREKLVNSMAEVARLKPGFPFAEHPAFGKLSHETWGALMHRHMAHHLTQFGA